MSIPLSDFDATVLSIVSSLAPDRMSPVTPDSQLVDDLGYDSPRKMELVVTLESHLEQQIPDPEQPIETVADVIAWVSGHLSATR